MGGWLVSGDHGARGFRIDGGEQLPGRGGRADGGGSLADAGGFWVVAADNEARAKAGHRQQRGAEKGDGFHVEF